MSAQISEDQRRYIEEVLGVTYFTGLATDVRSDELPTLVQQHEMLVLTPCLNDEERALLNKILSSVKMSEFVHAEVDSLEVGRFPEAQTAHQVLMFWDDQPGRMQIDQCVWWVMPSLRSMVGANAEVAKRKKEAWNLLQQFSKERGAT